MLFKPRIVELFGQPTAPVEAGVPTPVERKDAVVAGELIWVEVFVTYNQLYSIMASLGPTFGAGSITWWDDHPILVTQSCPPFEADRLRALMASVLDELGLRPFEDED